MQIPEANLAEESPLWDLLRFQILYTAMQIQYEILG